MPPGPHGDARLLPGADLPPVQARAPHRELQQPMLESKRRDADIIQCRRVAGARYLTAAAAGALV
jgi:hypothetical protein